MGGARSEARLQWFVGLGTGGLVLVGVYVVLAPFLVPIAWAAILAYATWPHYRWMRRLLGDRDAGAALVMTLLIVLAVVLPVGLLSLSLADEVAQVFRTLRAWATEPPDLPPAVAELPVVGRWLAGWHASIRTNPGTLRDLLADHAPRWGQVVLSAAGDVGRNLGRLGLTLLTVFFLYRHGEAVIGQTTRVLNRLAGPRVERLLEIVGATVRATCYGVLLTAVAQGVLAGLGFWAAGIPASVLLGALTAGLALLPFGPPLIWVPAGVWVLATSSIWKGVALLLWGALAVSGVDNVIRPYFIGGATQIPFLLVLFGVVGGMAAFGLLGLFIGPTILAVALVLWREWATARLPEAAAP